MLTVTSMFSFSLLSCLKDAMNWSGGNRRWRVAHPGIEWNGVPGRGRVRFCAAVFRSL